MVVPLEAAQFELGGLVFGHQCPVVVRTVDWGHARASTQDADPDTREGRAFGRDRHSGSTISFDLYTDGDRPEEALAAWEAFAAVWNDPAWRDTPGVVAALRVRSWGGQERVVYGRPRRLGDGDNALILAGTTKHLAEFDTSDAVFYDGAEQERVLTMAPNLGGGITYPITYPVKYAPVSTVDSHAVAVGGTRGAWPVITIAGPITNPAVTFLSTGVRFRITTALSHTQTLTIDPRPWAQTIRRSDGQNLRGAASPVPLSSLALPHRASTVVQFTGQDPSGTSTCTIRWRDAYSTPGGSL